jgi:hypothetical protein
MKRAWLMGMAVLLVCAPCACGGASKPPMQPDSDGTSAAAEGVAVPAASSAQPAPPAPPK